MSFLEIRRPGYLARAKGQGLRSLAHQFTPGRVGAITLSGSGWQVFLPPGCHLPPLVTQGKKNSRT